MMKRAVRAICLGLLLLFLRPGDCLAAGSADFGVQNNRAILRIKELPGEADSYKMLLFGMAEYQEQDVWVCVWSRSYLPEMLSSAYVGQKGGYIENVPAVDKMALKLFGKTGGVWEDCFGLCRSSMGFSDDSYEVTIEENTAEAETERAPLYLLLEDGQMMMPLDLAAELYGYDEETEGDRIKVKEGGTFPEEPAFFALTEVSQNGIILQEREVEVLRGNEAFKSESDTERGAKSASKSEPESESESETLTPMEVWTTAGAQTGQEESKVQTEPWTETESESERESESESESETLTPMEAWVVLETQAETEPESGIAGHVASQTAPASSNPGTIILIASLVLLVLVALIFLFLLLRYRRRQKTPVFSSGLSDEDTVTQDGKQNTAKKPAPKGISIQGAVVNNKGLVRGNNEDNFYFNGAYMHRGKMDGGAVISGTSREGVQLYAVCDGMGGTDSGEDASHRAAKELALRKQEHDRMDDPKELTVLLRGISEKINREATQKSQKSGTTIAMMLIKGKKAVLANVGDSRIYRLRDRELKQMSLDHSKVQRMISMGLLTPEKARTDPSRHVITQYLGMPTDVKVSPYIVENVDLEKGDVFVLCSDGLTDMAEDAEIEKILKQKAKPLDAAQELVKTALRHGGRDNVTVMVLRI